MERGAHVFAVDLDPQMNLTTFYVVNGGDLPVNNINDLLPVHDDSIHSDGPGIPVGSKVLAQQRKVLLTEMGTEGFLRLSLRRSNRCTIISSSTRTERPVR